MPVQNRVTRLIQTMCVLTLAVAMAIAVFAVVSATPVQAAAGEGRYQVVDGAGNVVTLDRVPQRIVSASVAGTEILFSIVDQERIIAVTTFDTDDYMSNVADKAKTAKNIIEFNAESVLVLDPDFVVVASWNNPDVVNQLKKAGLPVYVMADITAIEQIPGNIVALGTPWAPERTARQLAAEMEVEARELDALATAPNGTESAHLHDMGQHHGAALHMTSWCAGATPSMLQTSWASSAGATCLRRTS